MNKVYIYKREEALTNYIIKTKDDKDKWIIFVSDMRKGMNIFHQLQRKNVDVAFMYDDCINKKPNEEFNNIINNHKFNCKVFITTKLRDNNYYILDENVKNVVINTWSKNDMKSFIDKILNSNECNLYLDYKSKSKIKNKLKSVNKELNYFNELIINEKDFSTKYHYKLNQIPDGIYIDNKKFNYERETYANLLQIKHILSDLNDCSPVSYTKERLSWINLTYDDVLDFETEISNNYIYSLIDKPLNYKEQNDLINFIGIRDGNEKLQGAYGIIKDYLNRYYNLHLKESNQGEEDKIWIIKHKRKHKKCSTLHNTK